MRLLHPIMPFIMKRSGMQSTRQSDIQMNALAPYQQGDERQLISRGGNEYGDLPGLDCCVRTLRAG